MLTICSYLFSFYLEVSPGCARSFLLALCLEISPGGLGAQCGIPGIEPGLMACKVNALPIVCGYHSGVWGLGSRLNKGSGDEMALNDQDWRDSITGGALALQVADLG